MKLENAERIDVICRKDASMLREYSSRFLGRLDRKHLLVNLAGSLLHSLLEANVEKEVEKDELIIRYAAGSFEEQHDTDDDDAEEVFQLTKQVDGAFLKVLNPLPVSMELRYGEIRPVRIERIEILMEAVRKLLRGWQEGFSFEDVIRLKCDRTNYTGFLKNMMHLYNLEVRALGGMLKLRWPASTVAGKLAVETYELMEDVSPEVAVEFGERVFGKA